MLRKQNRILFEEMLQTSYKYSDTINAKGEQYSTESLLLSLIFDQHKLINNNNNKLNKNPRNQPPTTFIKKLILVGKEKEDNN